MCPGNSSRQVLGVQGEQNIFPDQRELGEVNKEIDSEKTAV